MATPCRARPWRTSRKGGEPQTFSYTATLTVNDGPNIAGNAAPYNVHRFWNWRVDVSNGSGTTTGDVWQFRVPLEAPTNNSTDVSVYCKFEWEASADYTSGVTTEGIYILDPNHPKPLAQGWYCGTTTTTPNPALTHKIVNLFPSRRRHTALTRTTGNSGSTTPATCSKATRGCSRARRISGESGTPRRRGYRCPTPRSSLICSRAYRPDRPRPSRSLTPRAMPARVWLRRLRSPARLTLTPTAMLFTTP